MSLRRLHQLAGPALLAVLLSLAAAAVIGRGAQVRLVPVLSASMHPHIPVGALVVTTPVVPSDITEGDVIAFAPPPPWTTVGDRPVLHRVATLTTTSDGTRTARTKGDANPDLDPWTLDLDTEATYARNRIAIPLLGFATAGGTLATAALLTGLLLLRATHQLHRRPPRPCTCPPAALQQPELTPTSATSHC